MTATKLWDAKFLFERERCAREEAVAALTDADWQEASAQFERELSDHVRGYRDCRDAACRRARRCVGFEPNCSGHPPPTTNALAMANERDDIEEIYARMQIARREAALRRETA